MGLIREIFGLAPVVERVVEVFVPNKTAAAQQAHLQKLGAQGQFAAEFQHQRRGAFDQFIDGLNRLPRPVMALGTVGLFVFSMADPLAFSKRMQGLAEVPEPLWWLLGAVVSFYFGAREMHHYRTQVPRARGSAPRVHSLVSSVPQSDNAAIADWLASKSAPDK
ncbi:hypothetical protein GCM10007939_06780 [Amylibacter marinus]|uniref:Holin of 3TMs, for gene-transfer release n=1 Tax=Amylibacter marinus TaxID=1475483 RepID=A0ABQ5VSU0_9RHOB|nr:holin family protein [Amylibacter marinus]GLQ34395.1 hypothetical protein GCM10007939_06780 [Amylibacter marinus]